MLGLAQGSMQVCFTTAPYFAGERNGAALHGYYAISILAANGDFLSDNGSILSRRSGTMHLIASRAQLQLLLAINGCDLSLSRLLACLRRKRPGQVDHFLAALFDCLRSEFVAWDGPCFSLTKPGSAILSLACQLRESDGQAHGNYRLVRGNLLHIPAEKKVTALRQSAVRTPVSVAR